MIPLFLGLTAANLICLTGVLLLGLFVTDGEGAFTSLYHYHITLAIFSGLLAAMTHVAIYMYFMATSRWLQAATDKANLNLHQYVTPALERKRKAFIAMMAAVGIVLLAMGSGAATDAIAATPPNLHLILGFTTLAVHFACSIVQYRLIQQQSTLMDHALLILNPQTA